MLLNWFRFVFCNHRSDGDFGTHNDRSKGKASVGEPEIVDDLDIRKGVFSQELKAVRLTAPGYI